MFHTLWFLLIITICEVESWEEPFVCPLTLLDVSLLSCFGGTVHLVIRCFSGENCSICSCTYFVSIGQDEFRVCLCCHLEHSFRFFSPWSILSMVPYYDALPNIIAFFPSLTPFDILCSLEMYLLSLKLPQFQQLWFSFFFFFMTSIFIYAFLSLFLMSNSNCLWFSSWLSYPTLLYILSLRESIYY